MNNVKNGVFRSNIQTIGLLVDESIFHHSEGLIQELISQGISSEQIKIVAYRKKTEKNKTYLLPTFDKKSIDWKGNFTEDFLNEFIETKFDLLISYYDIENTILMMITSRSKAKFKVGFAAVDEKLNRLMINTDLANYKLFVSELFKYLKSIK